LPVTEAIWTFFKGRQNGTFNQQMEEIIQEKWESIERNANKLDDKNITMTRTALSVSESVMTVEEIAVFLLSA
jgi:hypothetical protein